jgi:hypothetical protein
MNVTPYFFLKTSTIIWRLEQLAPEAWTLKWKRLEDMTRKPPVPYAPARSFASAEQAVASIIENRTGVSEWDRTVRTAPREFYNFSSWQKKEPL